MVADTFGQTGEKAKNFLRSTAGMLALERCPMRKVARCVDSGSDEAYSGVLLAGQSVLHFARLTLQS
jgi:hypothetical protein